MTRDEFIYVAIMSLIGFCGVAYMVGWDLAWALGLNPAEGHPGCFIIGYTVWIRLMLLGDWMLFKEAAQENQGGRIIKATPPASPMLHAACRVLSPAARRGYWTIVK